MDTRIGLALVLVALIVYWAPKAWRLFRSTRNSVTNEIIVDPTSSLTMDQRRVVAVSAFYAQQQFAFTDNLTTGMGKEYCSHLLNEWWEIFATEDAETTLSKVLSEGYHLHDAVMHAVVTGKGDEEIKAEIVSSVDQEMWHEVYRRAMNLQACLDSLRKAGAIPSGSQDMRSLTSAAWDYGRVSFVARLAYDAGYLDQASAWNYMERACTLARDSFSDWKQFSRSYLIGRAMWGGPDCGNEGMVVIADNLLDNPESPWVKLGWLDAGTQRAQGGA